MRAYVHGPIPHEDTRVGWTLISRTGGGNGGGGSSGGGGGGRGEGGDRDVDAQLSLTQMFVSFTQGGRPQPAAVEGGVEKEEVKAAVEMAAGTSAAAGQAAAEQAATGQAADSRSRAKRPRSASPNDPPDRREVGCFVKGPRGNTFCLANIDVDKVR